MATREHAVAIAGGGPAGMMLAAELALAEVDVVVVERRTDRALDGARAGGLHARTLEVLDQRGVAERFIEAGQPIAVVPFGTTMLDSSDLPSRHPYTLAIFQPRIERILADWIAELGVEVRHGRTVTGLTQDAEGVDVALDGGERLRARYLVGCDGGRSTVRRAAGIAFPGWEATKSNLVAECRLAEDPPDGVRHDATGVHGVQPLGDGRFRVIVTEQELRTDTAPVVDQLRATLRTVFGTDLGVHDVTWISRFTDATRQAAAYRAGRVLLAGDAAHVHYPAGGQGLSIGIQDAVNLGWKLARVVHGTSPERLLDSYHAERHPVTERTLRYTMALGQMQRRDDRMQAVVDVVSRLAAMDEPRRWLVALGSQLDVHYDLGDGHPLLGRRMPDLDLAGGGRVAELLRAARPVLLDLGDAGTLDAAAERVEVVRARCDGPWELPVLGAVRAPGAVLVRPDGHVAWVGEGSGAGLAEALDRWFTGAGAPGEDPRRCCPWER
jgi:3-(3-hydroxy-phenyl)propionate hydroxylase